MEGNHSVPAVLLSESFQLMTTIWSFIQQILTEHVLNDRYWDSASFVYPSVIKTEV